MSGEDWKRLESMGCFLEEAVESVRQNKFSSKNQDLDRFLQLIKNEIHYNGWFDPQNICIAIQNIASWLKPDTLKNFISSYPELQQIRQRKKIGIIMAGNIPLVGFHDYLMALLSGHRAEIKCSSDDSRLLPFLHTLFFPEKIETGEIVFTERLSNPDAVIATGSNNTSRYFEYYFGHKPHIFRKNRNSIAILTGDETEEDLQQLTCDFFIYYGLGCRNVSYLLLPPHYDMDNIFRAVFRQWQSLTQHHKYMNNLLYYRSVYALNKIRFIENGIVILKEDARIASPVSVIHYSYYENQDTLADFILDHKEELQCLVGKHPLCNTAFGATQFPAISQFADGIDTLHFLLHNV